jgi:predicted dehydrogenase
VGVIGCGYWGPQLIRNFYDLPSAQLVGVADPRPDRLDHVRHRYRGAQVFGDHRALLDTDVEAIVIATPIQTHYRLARDAILAGKHVLVEKPMTANVAEAMELILLARAAGVTLMSGHTFLYNPAVQALRNLVEGGELGKVYYVDAARLSLGLFQSQVNVLWDLAPHDISILSYVLDEKPVAVSARGSACVQPTVHDVAYLDLLYEGGVSAHVHVSWLDPAKVRRITVVGDRKMAVYNDVALVEKIRVYDKGVKPPATDTFGEFQMSYRNGEITIPFIPWQEPLKLECEHFIECVRSGKRPLTDGMRGLEVVAALEAADRSLKDGGVRVPVEIPAIPAPVEMPAVPAPVRVESLAEVDGRGPAEAEAIPLEALITLAEPGPQPMEAAS